MIQRLRQLARRLADGTRWRHDGASLLLQNLWRERFTRGGRYLVIGAVATGIAASFPDYMVGAAAFSFFASLLTVSMVISLVRRPRLQVQRYVPARCVVGSPAPMHIRVTNPTKREVLDVGAYEFRLPAYMQISDEAKYIPSLAAGDSHRFDYQIRIERRGSYHLAGPSVLSAFPFGLTQFRRFSPQAQRLIVYPSFKPLRSLDIPAGLRYQPGGLALASHLGESMEFVGTREYQVGDRVRDLHQRSWARVGMPVVKQFEEEFLTRIAMLVDTYSPGWGGAAALEANLSIAAAVADYLARQEYVVDLFAAGPQLYQFRAGRSLGYLENILDILACIERCKDDPLETIAPAFAEQLRETSTVVLLLLRWDPAREAMIQTIRDADVSVKPILVSNDAKQAEAAIAAGCAHLSVTEVEQGVEAL